MYYLTPCSVVVLFFLSFQSVGAAASAVAGVATASGSFRVDGNVVSGSATIFEGNTLETGGVSSRVRLYDGVQVILARESRGQVYRDRLVLEKGLSELQDGPGYWIEARGLRILAAGPGSAARAALSGERRVEVAALAGEARVTTGAGMVVAVLAPGTALVFEPQAAAGQPLPAFEMTGCLEQRDGHYVLRDLIAGVVEELRGENLERYAGDVVEVTATVIPGVTPVTGAMEVIQVSRIRRVRRGCPAPPAAAKPAPPAKQPAPPAQPAPSPAPVPAPQPAGEGGMSTRAKVVIAGVAVGGAGAGAYVLLKKKDDEPGTISP